MSFALKSGKQSNGHVVISADGTEVFPEIVLGRGVTAQLVYVTKELAEAWLTMIGKKQRSISRHNLDGLKSDLEEGRWQLTGQPVILDWDGMVIDGQHRLHMVASTGIPILTVVIRGVDPEAYSAIDGGRIRRPADALATAGFANNHTLGGAIRFLVRYESKQLKGMENYARPKITSTKTVEFAKEHAIAESVSATWNAGVLCHSQSAVGFCHYIFSGVDAADANTFFERLATGECLSKGDPILALRNRLIKERMAPDDLILLTFKVWNAFRRKRTLMQLTLRDGELLQKPI